MRGLSKQATFQPVLVEYVAACHAPTRVSPAQCWFRKKVCQVAECSLFIRANSSLSSRTWTCLPQSLQELSSRQEATLQYSRLSRKGTLASFSRPSTRSFCRRRPSLSCVSYCKRKRTLSLSQTPTLPVLGSKRQASPLISQTPGVGRSAGTNSCQRG